MLLLTVVVLDLRTGGRGGDGGEGEVEVDPGQRPGVEGVEAGHQTTPVWSVRGLNIERVRIKGKHLLQSPPAASRTS